MTARNSEHGLVSDVEVLKAEMFHCVERLDEHRLSSQEVLKRLEAMEKEKMTFRIAMATELGEIKTTLATEFGKLRETMAVQDDRYKRESGVAGAKWGGGVAAILTGIGFAIKEWIIK
jgi:pantothenate kinase